MKFLSQVYSTASGSIGGIVYSRNANGAYTRARATPIHPNTPRQSAQKAVFGAISRLWRTLDSIQKNSYVVYAPQFPYVDSIGQVKKYTSFQLFSKVNNLMLKYGSPIIGLMVAPVQLDGCFGINFTSFVASTSLLLNIEFTNGGIVPNDTFCIIDATRVYPSDGYSPKNPDFKFINRNFQGDNPSIVNLFNFYVAIFGELNVGDTLFFRTRLVSTITGQVSVPLYVPITIA
jgi:hypothetical protein